MRPLLIRKLDWTSYDNADRSLAYLRPHLSPSSRVLDVSCGEALIARMIQAEYSEASVVGIDVVDYRRTYFQAFLLYDGRRLPFRDRCFDLTLVSFVLHHVPPAERDALVDEIMRVTRRYLVVFEDTPTNALDRFFSYLHGRRFARKIGRPRQPFAFLTTDAWRRYFEARGLRVADLWRLGRLSYSPFQPFPRSVFLIERDAAPAQPTSARA